MVTEASCYLELPPFRVIMAAAITGRDSTARCMRGATAA
jgi:hypothetical protein